MPLHPLALMLANLGAERALIVTGQHNTPGLDLDTFDHVIARVERAIDAAGLLDVDDAGREDASLYQFEARQSDDDVKTDLELTCADCGRVLCDVEDGDSLGTLAAVATDHVGRCAPVQP